MSQLSIADIKEHVNLHDLIQHLYPSIKRDSSGNYYSPWRDDKNPSLSVYENGKKWKDHGINESGSAFDLVIKALNCSFKDARQFLVKYCGSSNLTPSTPPKKLKKATHPSYLWQLCKETNLENAFEYLESERCLSIKYLENLSREHVIDGCCIGYNNHKPDDPAYGHAVVFPLINSEGKLKALNMRYIAPEHRPKNRVIGNQEGTLFCPIWSTTSGQKRIWLCESPIDALSLHSIDLPAIAYISAELANSFPIEWIKDYQEIILWPDNDEAGQQAAAILKQRLEKICTVKEIAKTPYKDPNDVLRHENEAKLDEYAHNFNLKEKKQVFENDEIHKTDTGNAKRFVNLHGEEVLYCEQWKKWFIWNERYWEVDKRRRLERLAKGVARNIYKEAADELDNTKRRQLIRHGLNCENRNKISDMIHLVKSEVPVEPEELDTYPYLLNVQNGVIDLETGKLLSHKKSHYLTHCLNIGYDKHAKCPQWLKFLDRIMDHNPDLIGFLQCALGYSLTGDTSEECLFFLHGDGKNGKSTFIEVVLDTLLAQYTRRLNIDTLMQKKYGGSGIPNDIARLKGARVVVASEVQQGKRLNEALIKDITGEDTITARFLHGEFFDFKPVFKLWLYGNHKPVIIGMDEGIWRRIMMIPFSIQIPQEERDGKLRAKLKTELPGILQWALEGCLMWQKEGLNPPQEVMRSTADYRGEMDTIGIFLEECCITKPGITTPARDLYMAYEKWCIDNGEYALSQRRLGERLTKKGFERKKGMYGWSWLSIGLSKDMTLYDPLAVVNPSHSANTEKRAAKGSSRVIQSTSPQIYEAETTTYQTDGYFTTGDRIKYSTISGTYHGIIIDPKPNEGRAKVHIDNMPHDQLILKSELSKVFNNVDKITN